MNRCKSKPQDLPYAIKLRKLWAGHFYLSHADRDVLANFAGSDELDEEDAVAFVDERGEWLE